MTQSNAQPSAPRVFAIIPAAGASRRMGRPKQLLEVAGRPMLEVVAAPLIASSVRGVMVVTQSDIVASVRLDSPKVLTAINDDADRGMIDSIRIGIEAWAGREQISASDGFLVCPGDQPGLNVADIEWCIEPFTADPGRIVIARHAGRSGHPIIFPAHLAAFVRSAACDRGLNALCHRHADLVCYVDCRSPAVTRNINTPQDWDDME